MAVESPLLASPVNVMSAISPYTDFSLSPCSPPIQRSPYYRSLPTRNYPGSNLQPTPVEDGLSSSSAHLLSPMSDTVGPSPVTSNGTTTTDIEDDMADEAVNHEDIPRADSQITLKRLSTNLPDEFRASLEDESVSVIHAPEGYTKFLFNDASPVQSAKALLDRSTPTPYQQPTSSRSSPRSSPRTSPQFNQKTSPRTSPETSPKVSPKASPNTSPRMSPDRLQIAEHANKSIEPGPVSPPPISTDIRPIRFGLENQTPRAQTRQEVELFSEERRPSRPSSLEGIPEELSRGYSEDDFDANTVHNADEEILALKTALNECWTLCNTLASLSSIHRERIFSFSGSGDAHEKAWKCCWKLCKKLYDSRDEDHEYHVRPTLDLCRDFCQSLFDVRQKKDEVADSVLRVSFELNNHLYNTHDRNLPEAFRERTLDFYITLCHRLMKQRSELAEETDALLRACWGLAEMLFSLRQNKREGKMADEELLGSAVQACWELCDLFREGWTQVRPDRGTPRPSQTTFRASSDEMSRSSHTKSSSLASLSENLEEHTPTRYVILPETPTTDFEDTPITPEELSPNIPNIMVLGSDRPPRWSSGASSLSGYSQESGTSTVTNGNQPEDLNLTRLKILILKASMNVGYSRTAISSKGSPLTLQNFVKALPTGSFGSLPAHATLLTSYRNLVLSDPTFRNPSSLPPPGKKVSAPDVAKSVSWMMRSGQYTFLKDLFRMVFGFRVDEADSRKNVSISV
ncbi:5f5e4312-c0f2-4784-8247-082054a1cb76 [Sclerotinia trifoliorum]|uniref:5f5e4312-c0f2-4784-8247-082054a1cb76 n=1 Tax=Sclerotinia trifoliorum TaxID=28548 RepID=A0A8H2VP53_9HELO|nr:5f5e4312-c0f2-4784-8247-082054a1cb76 [Sclerotinia trifoliorum]